MKHLPNELQDTIKEFLVFKPKNKKEQQEAIDLWVNNKEKALDKYGDIKSWDTSLITEFHNTAKKIIFKPKTKKELQEAVNLWCKKKEKEKALSKYGYISNWDTSLITDMSKLFKKKKKF